MPPQPATAAAAMQVAAGSGDEDEACYVTRRDVWTKPQVRARHLVHRLPATVDHCDINCRVISTIDEAQLPVLHGGTVEPLQVLLHGGGQTTTTTTIATIEIQ